MWSHSWRGAFRIELRAEAIGLAWRGWPVLPGTYPQDSRWAGRGDVSERGPVPVHTDWQERIGTDPGEVAAIWGANPYTLLVATGIVLDAVEVSAEVGQQVARAFRAAGTPVPIAATPDNRWLFLTQSGEELWPELAQREDVRLHAQGSWIPLPPSPFHHGVVHWRVTPQVCGWQLPTSAVVQEALVQALDEEAAPELLTVQQFVGADGSQLI